MNLVSVTQPRNREHGEKLNEKQPEITKLIKLLNEVRNLHLLSRNQELLLKELCQQYEARKRIIEEKLRHFEIHNTHWLFAINQ